MKAAKPKQKQRSRWGIRMSQGVRGVWSSVDPFVTRQNALPI